MHKLIRFGSRIGSPPDPKLGVCYSIHIDKLKLMWLANLWIFLNLEYLLVDHKSPSEEDILKQGRL